MESVSRSRQDNREHCEREQRKESASRNRRRNNFLTSNIRPILGRNLVLKEPLVGMDSFKYLKNVYQNFIDKRSNGLHTEINWTGDNDHDTATMLQEMQQYTEEGEFLTLVRMPQEDGEPKMEFIQFVQSSYEMYEVYLLPMNILSHVKGDLRKVLLKFFAYMWIYNHFEWFREEELNLINYALGIEYYDENKKPVFFDDDEDDDCEECPYDVWKKRYLSGDINNLYEEIKAEVVSYKQNGKYIVGDLIDAMDDYRRKYGVTTYEDEFHGKHNTASLFQCITKGIALDRKDSVFKHDASYLQGVLGDDFDLCEDADYYDLENLYILGYSDDEHDVIMESFMDSLQNSNYGPDKPLVTYKVLTEDSDCSPITEDFPEEYAEWFKDLYNQLESNSDE